ncbi:MAG: TonB family protein [Vicinamibacterales bacterium]
MKTMRNAALVVMALALFGPPRAGTAQQDSFATARTLYASAAYEEALTMLDRLKPSADAASARGVAEYRAFCLLALDRKDEAQRAIEEVVMADPFFMPDSADTSPRIQAAFHEVRKRVLPGAVQRLYADAKASYDRKAFDKAVTELEAVVRLLSDPALEQTATTGDLKLLATGFLELARAAATPPAPPEPEPAPPAPPPAGPGTYYAGDPTVTPPEVRRQQVPSWSAARLGPLGTSPLTGVIEVLIDEQGNVANAVIRESIEPRFDDLLLDAARRWQYKPALRDGKPVRYLKRIQVVAK